MGGGNVATRLTDSNKWDDAWFADLIPDMKLLWLYLVDQCDHAGIWKVNKRMADFKIGKSMDWSLVESAFKGRLFTTNPEYWFIPKFLTFQYGKALKRGDAINSAIRLLKTSSYLDVAVDVLGDPLNTLLTLSDGSLETPKAKAKAIAKAEAVVDVEEGMGETKERRDKIREWFEVLWKNYPEDRRSGKAMALKSFRKRVKTHNDALWAADALEKYLESKTVKDGFIKNASTFFANLEDYADERRDLPGTTGPTTEPTTANLLEGLREDSPLARVVKQLADSKALRTSPQTDVLK